MEELQASIFTLPEPHRSITARDLWSEMASDLAGEFGDQYARLEHSGMRICLLHEATMSPDKKIVRYRTIEGTIRRRRGQPTLLDIAVGNLFSEAGVSPPSALHVVTDPQYALWARHAAQVPLGEHVRLVRLFTADLMDAGWNLEPTRLTCTTIPPPLVENGRGVQRLPLGKFRSLVRYPRSLPNKGMMAAIVWPDLHAAKHAADRLAHAFSELIGPLADDLQAVKCLRRPIPEAVNLVLLPDNQDLTDMPELREMLRKAEAEGIRLKLAKIGSISRTYPAMNIAYDMFLLGGGRPWTPNDSQLAFCGLDAGHHKEKCKSRWVKVATDEAHLISDVQVADTRLAEHIPASVLNAMWPSAGDAIICRDGKLSQEKSQMENRAAAENRALIESKKSPKAILWRQAGSELLPAQFGDAVIDPHGDLLLQTVPQSVQDYIHPVRLTTHGGDPVGLATTYLHQQAVPGLSLFHMSRLPGALYYADLISKLTGDGWPKAIGRGFRVPEIVP